jgi:hypothetical protein
VKGVQPEGMEERTTMMVQAIAREPAPLVQVAGVPCDHSRDRNATIPSECNERAFIQEPILPQYLKVWGPLFDVAVKIWKRVFVHGLLELLRVLPSQNTHDDDFIRVNPVVNRMPSVDAAAVSETDMVNGLPKVRILGQFLKSCDQPVVIPISPFQSIMHNAVFV